MSTTFLRVILAAAALVLAAGCSCSGRPPLGSVSGTVTLDGQPLANALVMFTPEGPGRTSLGTTDAEGKYTLAYLRDIVGANPGRHYVRITTATEQNGGREILPSKYHAQSTLSADVVAGSNTIDFSLMSR